MINIAQNSHIDRHWFLKNVQCSEYMQGFILNKYLKMFNSLKCQTSRLKFTIYNI